MDSITDKSGLLHQERILAVIGVLFLAPVILALAIGREHIILFYLAGVGACILVAFPRACLYLFMISVSIYYPYFVGRVGIHPCDICMLLLTASITLEFLLKGKSGFLPTRIDRYFLFLILATIISAVFAYKISYSIVPCFRIIVVFLSFRIVYGFAMNVSVRRLVNFYIYHVFVLSVINLIMFIEVGGQTRIFGPAWLAFETYSMTALPMAVAFYLLAEKAKDKAKYATIALVIGLAILGTQSRAPLLAVAIAIPILLVALYMKASGARHISVLSTLRRIVVPLTIAVVIALIFRETLYEGTFGRVGSFIESLRTPKETVYLRIVLWTAALKAFSANPITGIGIGNFRIVGEIVTEMKYQQVWYFISGMSAHNVILQYMAETGILGTLAIVTLAATNLKVAYGSFRRSVSTAELQLSTAILISIFVFCVTIFYMRAWTWGQSGYIMAMLFAFNVAWDKTLSCQRSEATSD